MVIGQALPDAAPVVFDAEDRRVLHLTVLEQLDGDGHGTQGLVIIPPDLQHLYVNDAAVHLFSGLAPGHHVIFPRFLRIAAGGQRDEEGVLLIGLVLVGVAVADDQVQAGLQPAEAGLAVPVGSPGVVRGDVLLFSPAGQHLGGFLPAVLAQVIDLRAGLAEIGRQGKLHVLVHIRHSPEGIDDPLHLVAAAHRQGAGPVGVDLPRKGADAHQQQAQQRSNRSFEPGHRLHPLKKTDDTGKQRQRLCRSRPRLQKAPGLTCFTVLNLYNSIL